jgi:hypothetical protein
LFRASIMGADADDIVRDVIENSQKPVATSWG